ncbi:glutathione S-transferase family protein [Thalassotalea sp. Y01]|uniref:glutathione S-transferase family protein n=1 Tax=Thalassotalea sp. Y01 TaxID=2729613 RepID=UPI00145EE951|nr:glutathione S-transferase family protein [Thalassotalea sp. Y01]NMP16093.1 glutathione S-transferase family protein [Thalassotalea sp. Y01]
MAEITLYGAQPSPYVRRVRLALAFKGLEYTQQVVFPFAPEKPAEFVDNSPTGKIPLLCHDGDYISDSEVIIRFLDRQYPQPALLPEDNLLAARSEWFATYSTTVMVAAIGGHLFAEMYLAEAFFNRPPAQDEIDLAISKEIPAIFDYLESELNDDYLVGNTMSYGDLSVCSMFVLMRHCKVSCDASKWPKTAAYIGRVFASDIFATLIAEEEQILRDWGLPI